MRMTARVLVTGKVQGVGYRAFVVREATALGIDGWVRNRRDGSVEAALCGKAEMLERLYDSLRTGPKHAKVASLSPQPHGGDIAPGFQVLATE